LTAELDAANAKLEKYEGMRTREEVEEKMEYVSDTCLPVSPVHQLSCSWQVNIALDWVLGE